MLVCDVAEPTFDELLAENRRLRAMLARIEMLVAGLHGMIAQEAVSCGSWTRAADAAPRQKP